MRTTLENLARIKTGIFAKPAGSGEVVYLQVRDFDETGHLKAELHPNLPEVDISPKHFLKQGDVLFAAKGSKNFATVFHSPALHTVASTSFFIIRLKEKTLLPDFLAWFLNSMPTQTLLKSQAIGSSIPSISKQVLASLDVPMPDKRSQQLVVEIDHLHRRRKALEQQLGILHEKSLQLRIFDSFGQKEKNNP
jgi:restriction endonuclease S subunit